MPGVFSNDEINDIPPHASHELVPVLYREYENVLLHSVQPSLPPSLFFSEYYAPVPFVVVMLLDCHVTQMATKFPELANLKHVIIPMVHVTIFALEA